MSVQSNLPSFHTFDPITHDPIEVIPQIQSSLGGDHEELKRVKPNSADIQNLRAGIEPGIDPATLLYLTIIDLDEFGGRNEGIDAGVGKERLGRFPYADGNIVTYLLTYTKQKGDMTTLHELFYQDARDTSIIHPKQQRQNLQREQPKTFAGSLVSA